MGARAVVSAVVLFVATPLVVPCLSLFVLQPFLSLFLQCMLCVIGLVPYDVPIHVSKFVASLQL